MLSRFFSSASSLLRGNEKQRCIVLIGLDSVGKTGILYQWARSTFEKTIPTIGFNVDTVKLPSGQLLEAWDVGGGYKIRPLWRSYVGRAGTLAAVLVVDSTDRTRLNEAKDSFQHVLASPELSDIIIVVLANKQDIAGAMNLQEISDGLQLDKMVQTKHKLFGISAKTGQGMEDPLEWLETTLAAQQRE